MKKSVMQRFGWRNMAVVVLCIFVLALSLRLINNVIVIKSIDHVHEVAKDLAQTLLIENQEQISAQLLSLNKVRGIERVELVTSEGVILVNLERVGGQLSPMDVDFALASVHSNDSEFIQFAEPIVHEGSVLGNLNVVFDSWSFYKSAILYIGCALMLLSALYAVYRHLNLKVSIETIKKNILNEPSDDEFKLQKVVSEAMRNARISVEYQPVYRLNDGHVCGFELVICWQHPSGQTFYYSCADFLLMTERWEIALPLEEWVLRSACGASLSWQEKYGPLAMSFELSEKLFTSPNLIQFMRDISAEINYPSQLIELQISESVLAQVKDSRRILEKLRDLNASPTVCKFGLTTQSLELLDDSGLIRKVKLDGRLITNLENDSYVKEWVTQMMNDAHSKNVSVIAEGIKNDSQKRLLMSLGCTQGHSRLGSGVLPAEKFEALLVRESTGSHIHQGYSSFLEVGV